MPLVLPFSVVGIGHCHCVSELCKFLALLCIRYLDLAAESPQLRDLGLHSSPNSDLAADASIQIPLVGVTVFGFHLEANAHAAAPKIAKLSSLQQQTARGWQG